jgi:hypothetical protein
LLGSLANNGGETDTMALLTGSPAINAGDPSKCPATDQRGLPRPQLGGCDIGAYEVQPPTPMPAPPTPVAPAVPGKPSIGRHGKLVVKIAGSTFLVKPGLLVACPSGGASCSGTIRATAKATKPKNGRVATAAKKIIVGKAKFTIAAGKSKALSLKLTRKGAAMLDEAGRLRTKIEVVARAGSGATVTKKLTVVLKLPAKK